MKFPPARPQEQRNERVAREKRLAPSLAAATVFAACLIWNGKAALEEGFSVVSGSARRVTADTDELCRGRAQDHTPRCRGMARAGGCRRRRLRDHPGMRAGRGRLWTSLHEVLTGMRRPAGDAPPQVPSCSGSPTSCASCSIVASWCSCASRKPCGLDRLHGRQHVVAVVAGAAVALLHDAQAARSSDSRPAYCTWPRSTT